MFIACVIINRVSLHDINLKNIINFLVIHNRTTSRQGIQKFFLVIFLVESMLNTQTYFIQRIVVFELQDVAFCLRNTGIFFILTPSVIKRESEHILTEACTVTAL